MSLLAHGVKFVAVQVLVVFDMLHERVTGEPLYTAPADAENAIVGATGFATFTFTLLMIDPPAPIHSSVYVLLFVIFVNVCDWLLPIFFDPDQSPVA